MFDAATLGTPVTYAFASSFAVAMESDGTHVVSWRDDSVSVHALADGSVSESYPLGACDDFPRFQLSRGDRFMFALAECQFTHHLYFRSRD